MIMWHDGDACNEITMVKAAEETYGLLTTKPLPNIVYKGGNTIRTLHDCPSQMNENLLISNSKLTSDSELIWWR